MVAQAGVYMKSEQTSSAANEAPAPKDPSLHIEWDDDTAQTSGGGPEMPTFHPVSDCSARSAELAGFDVTKFPMQFGRYELHSLLGQGGMGSVYLAHDTQLDRPVALKIPQFGNADDDNARQRFLREARAAATIHHANICPIYDAGEIDGKPYLTMAYIEGRPLSEVIPRGGVKPLPERQVATIVRRLALALHEAHRLQVVHRDLKPSNIMLNAKGEPIIMDFGLARRGTHSDPRLTQAGMVVGTPAYMSPEQAEGLPEGMGPSCDVYSLGIVLYEMLTGRVPFEGSMLSVLTQVVTEQPPRPSAIRPGIDPVLEEICLKAIAKSTNHRFSSMADLAAALGDYLKKTQRSTAVVSVSQAESEATRPPITDTKTPLPQRPKRRRVRQPRGRLSLGLGLLACFAVGVLAMLIGRNSAAKPRNAPKANAAEAETAATEMASTSITSTGTPTSEARAAVTRAASLLAKHQLDSALREAETAVHLDRQSTEAWRVRGEILQEKNDLAASILDCTEALKLDSNNLQAFVVRGVAHARLGEHDAAIKDLTAALRIDPNNSAASFNRGCSYYRLKQYTKALSDFDRVIGQDRQFALAYLERGRVFLETGDPAKAQVNFDAACKLSPALATQVPTMPSTREVAKGVGVPRWPQQSLLRAEIPAPEMSLVHPRIRDDFSKPGGFPQIRERCGYAHGKYEIIQPSFWNYLNPGHHLLKDFACQVEGRLTQRAGGDWCLAVVGPDKSGFTVAVGIGPTYRISPSPWNTAVNHSIETPWTKHPALHVVTEPSTLLVVVRDRIVELYINGKAAGDPFLLEHPLEAATIRLGTNHLRGTAHAEFGEFIIWPKIDALPSLEKRGASSSY